MTRTSKNGSKATKADAAGARVSGTVMTSEMTVGRILDECAAVVGGADSRGEAREIVAAVLDVNRSWPSVHPGDAVPDAAAVEILRAAAMRATGAPLQYALGTASFRHLTLYVDRNVLIPRPETEVLVDLILARVAGGSIADVGTGSGAIALALATEGRFDRVIATDVSAAALEVAGKNASACADRIRGKWELRLGSMLAPLAGEALEALVSNPPYIADDEVESLPPSVRDWEPEGALRSGREGLDATIAIIAGAPGVLLPGGLLALEVDTRRAERTADILKADGRYEQIETIADLTGRPRFLAARRR